jgi:hypothetical protein
MDLKATRFFSEPIDVRAASRGSWGVGRDFFRVSVDSGRVFDLHGEHGPKGADLRKGGWFLLR